MVHLLPDGVTQRSTVALPWIMLYTKTLFIARA